MALTGAVYKWRLDNTSYAYITDESETGTGGTPFIAINENNIDEGKIKEKVVSWNEQKYCEQFKKMVNMVHGYDEGQYSNLQFLDCSIYLNEFSDCPDSVLKPLIPTDIALTVEATPDTVQAEFIGGETVYSDGEYLKKFTLKLNIPTEEGVEYTAGENIDITTGNTISALGYRYDQDKDSIAVGSGSIGLGMWSHAEGYGTQANGNASHAEGKLTTADGDGSHAGGSITKQYGDIIAEGVGSLARGVVECEEDVSSIGGGYIKATGVASHAEGFLRADASYKSFIEASGEGSFALGSAQLAKIVAEGRGSFAGGCNGSEYKPIIASGEGSFAFGANSDDGSLIASGYASHAEGCGTSASGHASHAEGDITSASGDYSHAEGYETTAIGESSHAEGYETTAIGESSHAEGNYTTAEGLSSHAEGNYTTTSNYTEHAEGNHNISHNNSTTYGDSGNTQHSIGIGSEGLRKNALEVMQNGDIYITGIGGYTGTNTAVQDNTIQTLQKVLEELNNSGGSSSGITYVGGNNIDITGNTITAKGYTYDTDTLEFSGNILSLDGGNATIQYDNNTGSTNGLKVTTSEGDINISSSNNMDISAEGSNMKISSEGNMNISVNEKIDISSNNDMNITANGETMNITATEGDINISSEKGDINISSENNFSVDSSSFSSTCPITAEVNGVENVYLGCPIGTIVMWAGQTAPNGWLLCDGTGIPVYNPDNKGYMSKACTIQDKSLNDNELTHLVFTVFRIDDDNSHYGRATYYYVEEQQGWVKTGDSGGTGDNTYFMINSYTTDVKEALKFYSEYSKFVNTFRLEVEATPYTCINLPDLQQRFPLGVYESGSIGLGVTGGTSANTLEMANLPQDMANYYLVTSSSQPQASKSLNDAASGNYFVNEDTCLHSNGIGQPSSTAFTNMPPYLAINFIIKYK